jgi:adenine-specific DNA-methyltransferase
MSSKIKSPFQFLNPAYRKMPVVKQDVDLFKEHFSIFLKTVDEKESEEHSKNKLIKFLYDSFYNGKNEINTKGRIDLAIYEDSEPIVIIENKKPKSNDVDMISKNNLNAKAMYELILYYLRERIEFNNTNIKYLIATNIYEWFIFDERDFDKFFFRDTQLVKHYETYRNESKDTEHFYKSIAKPFIEKRKPEFEYCWFDIREQAGRDKIRWLYKFFSPQNLLKQPIANDSNFLNKEFYHELLHIIGLEEVKDGGKKIIKRKAEGKRDEASLIENVIFKLDQKERISKLQNPNAFGDSKEEQYYQVALELCITWIDRILFLKLLESQLIRYHKDTRGYKFLNSKTISDFDALNNLFFSVLAKKHSERKGEWQSAFEKIPYLNSSLFEPTSLENDLLGIDNLDNNLELNIYNNTVLKDDKGKKHTGKLNSLEYIFHFLDAYNFASEGTDEEQADRKQLINASVLGLIFEKINGYKDGSFFTPGFITMYMSRETLRRVVLQKFNEKFGWKGEKFDDLYNHLARNTNDILLYNTIIDELKICDPAVGSGHFLVSVLNELIAIKSELGILADDAGKRLPVSVTVENDELLVLQGENIFEYSAPARKNIDKEKQRIQHTLFHEKQKLIENCLFGVDINGNSVKICRLRLWVELLKNAYYTELSGYTELETLPNIDINIKRGDSLISRFKLDDDLSKALKSIRYNIEQYRGFVNDYKNERNREVKKGLVKIIDSIKTNFRAQISQENPTKKRLDKLMNELYYRFTGNTLFEPEQPYGKKNSKANDERIRLESEIKILTKRWEEIKNDHLYRNAFEWRFEFPEILDDRGSFVGFDLVIGNPPYISAWEMHEKNDMLRKKIIEIFPSYKKLLIGHWDLYIPFILRSLQICKANGYCTYIIPNPFLREKYASAIRKYMLNETDLVSITLFEDSNVFTDVARRTIIYLLNKSSSKALQVNISEVLPSEARITFKNSVEKSQWRKSKDYRFNTNADSNIFDLLEKIDKKSLRLGNVCYVNYGAQVSSKEKGAFKKSEVVSKLQNGNAKKFFEGKDVHRWELAYRDLWLDYREDDIYGARFKELFETSKLVIRKVSDKGHRIAGAYDENHYYTDDGCVLAVLFRDLKDMLTDSNYFGYSLTDNSYNLKFILAQILSNITTFYFKNRFSTESLQGDTSHTYPKSVRELPIVIGSQKEQQPVIILVDKILSAKKDNPKVDVSSLEKEIDKAIYVLYGLTEEEIKIVEGNPARIPTAHS